MLKQDRQQIEVRGFLHLYQLFKKRNWPVPLLVNLAEPISGIALAEKLEIPLNEIEVIFVNGFVQSLHYSVQPGDRVAFLPPGCPGPHRFMLGFYGKNQDNKFNFTLKKEEESG